MAERALLIIVLLHAAFAWASPKCPPNERPEWATANARAKRELVRECIAEQPPRAPTPSPAPKVDTAVRPLPPEPIRPRPIMWGIKSGSGVELAPILLGGTGCICGPIPLTLAAPTVGLEFSVAFAPHQAVQLAPLVRVEGSLGPGPSTLTMPPAVFHVSAAIGARLAAWFARVWGVGFQLELGATTLPLLRVKPGFVDTIMLTPQVSAALVPAHRFGSAGEYQLALELRVAVMAPQLFDRFLPELLAAGSALLSWTTFF